MLHWNTTQQDEKSTISTQSTATANTDLKLAIEACAEKMIDLLKNNILEDSLYLMFEWNQNCSTLVVVVTDASKQQDAPQRVECVFIELSKNLNQLTPAEFKIQTESYADSIKFWLHDYLSSCTAFFKFSLVAIFHSNSRELTALL